MADPASILGLIAASLTITIRAASIGKDMHTLMSKFKTTNRKVKQLSIHVAAVRVAARSLSSWLEDDAVGSEEVEDVKRELLEVLTASCGLMSDLQDHVAKVLAGAESVGLKGAAQYIWDEDIVIETTETLHHQETILILMLQALERLNQKEQRAKLREQVVVQALRKAKRPSSSIFGIKSEARSSARFSFISQSSGRIEEVFSFDMEVINSTVYRSAFTLPARRILHEAIYTTVESIEEHRPASTSTITYNDVITSATKSSESGAKCLEVNKNAKDRLAQHVSIPRSDSPIMQIKAPTRTNMSPFDEFHTSSKNDDLSSYISIAQKDTTRSLPAGSELTWLVSQHMRDVSNQSSDDSEEEKASINSTTKGAVAKPALPGPRPVGQVVWQANGTSDGDILHVRALHSYKAQDLLELEFQQGDIIRVFTMLRGGWWDGVLKGVRGWFPNTYCEILAAHEYAQAVLDITKSTRTSSRIASVYRKKN